MIEEYCDYCGESLKKNKDKIALNVKNIMKARFAMFGVGEYFSTNKTICNKCENRIVKAMNVELKKIKEGSVKKQ